MSKTMTNKREQTVREIWLLYFNRYLLEKGIITEQEHDRMKLKIQALNRTTV